MKLSDSLTLLRGVGPEVARKLNILGLETIEDLLTYYPRRFDDYSHVTPIAQLKPGAVTIKAAIKQVKGRYVRRGMHITEAVCSDTTGSVKLVWFNQPYREASLKSGEAYFISGNFELRRQRFSINNPSIELETDFPVNTARIVPIYRETKGIKSSQLRKFIKQVLSLLNELPETLPEWILRNENLVKRADAIRSMHFPLSNEALEQAKKRLGFEEVFQLTLASLLNKCDLSKEVALSIPFDEQLAKEFVSHLPFELTSAQRKVIWRIYLDMQKTSPMNRLVEGDVGSGKTVVAVMAAIMAIKQGFQVALMAPTELLARQHAESIYNLLKPLGQAESVGLLVGGLSSKQKAEMHDKIAVGIAKFIVGTHALIQSKVSIKKLGLVIVDEQHRFGVDQRKALQAKAGHNLHVLNMTATPIPRSLALTLYGELDVSIIDSKPAGRKSIVTEICSPNSRKQLYKTIESELKKGRQMFVVAPQITESDSAKPGASVESIYKHLSQSAFKSLRIGLLHGKMKPAEKNDVMERFVKRELDILVSTTVIEVGVDVPNATIMLIESADQFGLAQIHQLRGRVGRGNNQGYCYLMMSDSSAPSQRLQALKNSNDGFRLAELDLELRGPGAIYGTFQHGQLDLRIAKLSDTKLIAAARQSAQKFIDKNENLLKYKHLADKVKYLRAVTNLN